MLALHILDLLHQGLLLFVIELLLASLLSLDVLNLCGKLYFSPPESLNLLQALLCELFIVGCLDLSKLLAML